MYNLIFSYNRIFFIFSFQNNSLSQYSCFFFLLRQRNRRLTPVVSKIAWLLTNGHAEAVFVDGSQNSPEGRERGAPHGMLEIVARAVHGPVLAMEAHIGTVHVGSVRHATRQVRHQLQMSRRQQLLVREICKHQPH